MIQIMKFNRFFLAAVICIVTSIFVTSCSKDDDKINTNLVRGAWAVERNIDDDLTIIYNFTTNSSNTYSWGTLVTSFLRHPDGVVFHDCDYDFHIFDEKNNGGVATISLTLVAELDSSEPTTEPTVIYRIDKVTSTEMHWTLVKGEGEPSLSFIRYTPKS